MKQIVTGRGAHNVVPGGDGSRVLVSNRVDGTITPVDYKTLVAACRSRWPAASTAWKSLPMARKWGHRALGRHGRGNRPDWHQNRSNTSPSAARRTAFISRAMRGVIASRWTLAALAAAAVAVGAGSNHLPPRHALPDLRHRTHGAGPAIADIPPGIRVRVTFSSPTKNQAGGWTLDDLQKRSGNGWWRRPRLRLTHL